MTPARTALPDPTSRGFDADDHYYEAEDAFTRHMDRFIPNPTFDPVAKPGSLDEYFRGRNPKGRRYAR